MLEHEQELKKATKPPVAAAVIALALLMGLATLGFFWWHSQEPEEEPQLTPEAADYLPNLELTGVEMMASEDFLGQTLLTIEGQIANKGEKTVEFIEVNCVFRDLSGLEIDRQPRTLVGGEGGVLEPGRAQTFRLAFDAVPPEWNQAMPNLYIFQIRFGE